MEQTVKKSDSRLWADLEQTRKQSVEQIVDQPVDHRKEAADCSAGVE